MKRVVALIMVAIALAAATGVSSFYYLQNAEQQVLSGMETVTVLETAVQVPAGTSYGDAVGQGFLTPTEIPAKFAAPSMLTPDADISTNLLAGRDLAPGRIVFSGDFVPVVEANQVLPIPSGMVAVSFPLPEASRLAPFLAAGDHVAVVDGKFGVSETNLGTPVTVFDDVLVLAVANVSAMGTGVVEGSAGLVTVAVPAPDAPRLVKAVNGGAIYLAMLSTKG